MFPLLWALRVVCGVQLNVTVPGDLTCHMGGTLSTTRPMKLILLLCVSHLNSVW